MKGHVEEALANGDIPEKDAKKLVDKFADICNDGWNDMTEVNTGLPPPPFSSLDTLL